MAITTAQDVMTDSVVSVGAESSLLDVLRVFVEENIHGAPVVDQDEQILGVITTSDLLRAQQDEHDTVSTTSMWVSVPPVTRLRPSLINAAARLFALRMHCSA